MNNTIFFFFYNLAHKSDFFDNLVIFFAVYVIYLLIVLAFLFLSFRLPVQVGNKFTFSKNSIKELINKYKEFIFLCLSGGLAFLLAKILKILIHTQRPFDMFSQVQRLFLETGYAFPSGHTATASAIAFTLFFLNKKMGSVFLFFALLIGLSRIIAGVHFPVDILGGFVLGGVIAWLVNKVAYFVK